MKFAHIKDVESEFHVVLDKADAHGRRRLRVALEDHAFRFRTRPFRVEAVCAAICQETGADGTLVGEQTQLLAPPLIEQLKGWLERTTR